VLTVPRPSPVAVATSVAVSPSSGVSAASTLALVVPDADGTDVVVTVGPTEARLGFRGGVGLDGAFLDLVFVARRLAAPSFDVGRDFAPASGSWYPRSAFVTAAVRASLESVELTVARPIPVANATSAAVIVPPLARASSMRGVVEPRPARPAAGAVDTEERTGADRFLVGSFVSVEFEPARAVDVSCPSPAPSSWMVSTRLELMSDSAEPASMGAGSDPGA
jgi:hypothetical protein